MQTGKGILIPSILKVGSGTLKKIGQYLKAENLEQVVIFFGNGLIDLFGMDVMDSLKQEGITVLGTASWTQWISMILSRWHLQCRIRPSTVISIGGK